MSFDLFKYFQNKRLIRDQINEIIERRYNGYRGDKWTPLKLVHTNLRREIGSKKFLQFLLECEEANPKPEFKPNY